MNRKRHPFRRLAAILMLALALATTSAMTARANSAATGGPGSEPGVVADGFWAAATCAFSLALAKVDSGFYGSALLICARVILLDP